MFPCKTQQSELELLTLLRRRRHIWPEVVRLRRGRGSGFASSRGEEQPPFFTCRARDRVGRFSRWRKSRAFLPVQRTIGEYTTSGATVNASLITGLDSPVGIVVVPVPEPGTSLLVMGGALGLAGVRGRRRF